MRVLSAWCVLVLVLAASTVGCGSVATSRDGGGDDTDAAGPGPDPDDGAVSGTRLKLLWLDFGGTRVGGTGAHDTTANLDCYAQQWDDDAYYCTPQTGSVVYTNATCTNAIAYSYSSPSCPSDPPAYFAEYGIDNCVGGGIERIYRRGAQVAQTQYYQRSSDGTCYGPYTDANITYYALGTQLGRGELAALTSVTGEPGNRYAQRYYESADGARMFDRVHDTQLDTGCYLQAWYDSPTVQCVPDSSNYAGYYTTPTCTIPATGVTTTCEASEFMVQYPTAVCNEDARPRHYLTGTAITAPYSGSPSACNAVSTDPSVTYYGAGSELTFPTLTREVDTVGGRQVQLMHVADGELRIRAGGLYDAVHDARCYTFLGAGGQYQCLPYDTSLYTYYSDPSCTTTTQVVELYRGDPSCDPPRVPTVATRYLGGCPETFEFYEVGGLVTAPVYYPPGDGTCVEDTRVDVVRYAVGAMIPQSAFASGTQTTDP